MKVPQLTIPKGNLRDPALDHRQLYALGLKQVQRLAGQVWTDHNIHDPGITTLELLCYALTDLAYRASWPVEDLLASASDNRDNMQRQFFSARQILPNRPLSKNDYRKLLIDLDGVKNAWLEEVPYTCWLDKELWELTRQVPPYNGEKVTINGRYRVAVDFDDRIARMPKQAKEKATAKVLESVRQSLHANRNLCQDFIGCDIVDTQDFTLCARLELSPQADTAQVRAEVEFRVRHHLSPAVPRYTLAQMLARKTADGTPRTIDRIFDGPTLSGGFIDDSELENADLRKEILLSDIISIIMDIPGVEAIPQIVIHATADPAPPKAVNWRVPVAAGKKAMLAETAIAMFKRNMPAEPHDDEVKKRLAALESAGEAEEERILNEDLPIPLGRSRNAARYHSFQNDFPAIYGLSEAGLDGTATPARKALAWQLKGYLLFFDQIMSDYLAQLQHVKDLLSVNGTRNRSLYSAVVNSFRDYLSIYETDATLPGADAREDKLREQLAEMVENEGTRTKRRNRFLDHLLARFAERFTDYAHMMYEAFGAGSDHVIPLKRAFLSAYPAIGSERGLAFDYRNKSKNELWDTCNVSGFERRIAHLLGFDPRRRDLSRMKPDEWSKVEEKAPGEYRFTIVHRVSNDPLLAGPAPYSTREEAEDAMLRAIYRGKFASHYLKTDSKAGKKHLYTFSLTDEKGGELCKRSFNRPHERDKAISDLMEYLRTKYDDEGMYVIEHILLLPEQGSDPYFPICRTEQRMKEPDRDPYSYRMHVVLPGYTSRFSNLAFRRYAEEVIRQETPAHILPIVCWIGREKMEILEKSYCEWLYLKASAVGNAGRAQKILKFIYSLLDGKNIYPKGTLHCGKAGDKKTKFMLNRTSLGSGEES